MAEDGMPLSNSKWWWRLLPANSHCFIASGVEKAATRGVNKAGYGSGYGLKPIFYLGYIGQTPN